MRGTVPIGLAFAALLATAGTEAKKPVCDDPQYTDEAAKANIKGVVRLSAMVGADGCARDIRVVSSLGYGLDDAAIAAVERCRFHKYPKPAHVNVEFNFDPQLSSRRPLTAPKCGNVDGRGSGKE